MSSGSARLRPHPTSIGLGSSEGSGKFLRAGGARSWRRWELWTLRPSLLTYVLTVEVVALGTTVAMLSHQRIGSADLLRLGALVALGLGKEELTRHVERMRRRYSDTPHQNMTSVWTLAAALVLPPGLAVVVVGALYAYLWLRIWSPVGGTRAWKALFSAAAVTLSCYSATAVMHIFVIRPTFTGPAVLMAGVAILIYSMVNLGLVAGAIAFITSERTLRRLFGTAADSGLEYATLTLGAVTAVLMLDRPWFVLMLIPTLVLLHRNLLVRQLEEAASKDPKTGLLNAVTWRAQALAELDRANREHEQLGVLMLDLDHFKTINDGNGHLLGDKVLVAVAELLKQETRPYDVLGRFGGDEFVMLCPGVDGTALADIAERIRGGVERLAIPHADRTVRVTVSVGAAHFPEVGPELDDLLLAADNALFAAKDRARNRVVIVRQRSALTREQESSAATSS